MEPQADPIADQQQQINVAVTAILATRSAIDHTKGMLMLIYGIDEGDAFELLRGQARRTQVKIHALATQFLRDVAELDYHHKHIPPHDVLHQLLHTAHHRLPRPAD